MFEEIRDSGFFIRDVLEVAPELIGQYLVRRFEDGRLVRSQITDLEIYRGSSDLACHASKGRTVRTEIMYHAGGHVYMYLIYGMYWMLNIVCGSVDQPQAILIRGIPGHDGPGKLTRFLELDKQFYGENLCESKRIWIESDRSVKHFQSQPRIGIDYAGKYWAAKPWNYMLIQ